MLSYLSLTLLALAVSARPTEVERDGGLLSLLPAVKGLLPIPLTNELYKLFTTLGKALPKAVPIAPVQTTVFGTARTTGTIIATVKGDPTIRYLGYTRDQFAEYNLITDRSLAENFSIPAYVCGPTAKPFGIATTSDTLPSPFMAPAESAPGATAVQSDSGNVGLSCQSDVWNMDCTTHVLSLVWVNASTKKAVPLTLSVGAGSYPYEVNTMTPATLADSSRAVQVTYKFVPN